MADGEKKGKTVVNWTAGEEADLVAVLLEQKHAGNQAESGWKPVVWTKVEERLAANHPNEARKDIKRCKDRWQRLKSEYRLVRELREQSGFGWDEVKHLATAPHDVWERYLASHPKAKPFRKKSFPLYDDIATLVDSVVATGASALYMGSEEALDSQVDVTTDGGTDFGPDEDQGQSGESDNETPSQARNTSKKRAHEPSLHSGTSKRQRKTAVDGFHELADAIKTMTSGLLAGSSSDTLATPERKTKAIRTVEKEEGLSPHGMADAASVFMTREKHDTYLAFENKDARRIWLQREIERLDQL